MALSSAARPRMIDTKLSDKEKKLDMPMPASKWEGPDYPYELRVTLDEATLKKLGMKAGDFKLGDKVEIVAMTEVMSTNESKHANRGGTHEHARIELQIKKLHVCEPGDSVFGKAK